ncbi:polyprenol reductase-like [Oppia nitens]|uniref:polyprenol reductase-like n=1 Tax=Oppia nitens TaxID=1686743 RepID=UPI0023D97C6C|nr:polyprenol reductase-like [Oppia nitens]
MTFQVTRRLYENGLLFKSNLQTFNIISYFGAYLYYPMVTLAILCEVPALLSGSINYNMKLANFLTFNHIVGCLLFATFWWLEFSSHLILVNLRKGRSGGHYIPRGQLFEYVSSPHYFAEIIVYLAIIVVLGGQSVSWWLLTLFVWVYMSFLALHKHQWYLAKFKTYPSQRKAIIPFLL